MSKYGIGYWKLNNREKNLYARIENALRNYETQVDVSTGIDVMEVLSTVLEDNPDIVHVINPRILLRGGGLFQKAIIIGSINRHHGTIMEGELKKKTEEIVWEVDRNARSDRDILMGVSEYFQRNILYDYKGANNPYAHNAYGALVQNLAVCEGIAKAYSLVLSYFNIRSMVVSGRGQGTFSFAPNHAWNIVEFENEFYHCDITWDLCGYANQNMYSYQYFGLDDSDMSLDHQWKLKDVPKCTENKLSYYNYNKLIAYSNDQITEMIKRQYKMGIDVIRLKMDDKILVSSGTSDFIVEKIRKALGRCGFKYNWNENTRCLTVFEIHQ